VYKIRSERKRARCGFNADAAAGRTDGWAIARRDRREEHAI
jgi:hypothetical protein